MYVARFGSLQDVTAGERLGEVVPDRNMETTIISVRRNADQTLAEIDAGSRDGVKEGWVMTIARGGDFVGNLRIISVDINRSTGVVELEQATGIQVEIGDRALARSGED